MKDIIYKELKLGIHPAAYISLIYSLMAFIPNYPPIFCLFMPLVTIPQFIFSFSNENRDYDFCNLLPIKKGDFVKMKLFDYVYLEVLCLILSFPMLLISKYAVYSNPENRLYYANFPGVTSIFVLYGAIFIVFGLVNSISLLLYFKRFPKYAFPMIFAMVLGLILCASFGVAPAFVPGLSDLISDKPSNLWFKIIILVCGFGIYVLLNFLGYKFSKKALLSKS